MTRSTLLLALFASLSLTACKTPPSQPPTAASPAEAKWLAVLRSNADLKDKADACRQLARCATPAAVPALAALLNDPQLSHMARYALEPIPGPAVDTALRAALPTLQGRQRAGVITSLGVRRDARAVPLLAGCLNDADPDVACAAARALGDIGTASAAAALEGALGAAPAAKQWAVCEGLFRCAEHLTAAGQRSRALRIYDRLRALSDAPQHVRAGALRGAVLSRGQAGLPILEEALCGADWVLAQAAARTALEMPDGAATAVLTSALGRVGPDRKLLVLEALGQRADAQCLPTVLAAARQGEVPVRVAAVRTLARLQSSAAAAPLAELLLDPQPQIAEAARESLAALPGEQADEVVLGLVTSQDKAKRLAGLDQVARRRMSRAVPLLEQAADAADPQIRNAALKQLGAFGGEAELTSLLNRLERAGSTDEMNALADALSTLCGRLANPDLCAERVVARMSSVKPPQQASLLRVLAAVGGARSLAAVRAAVQSPDGEVRAAAVAALNDWPTADAAPELLALARKAEQPDVRTRCLRRYLGWAADTDLPQRDRLAMCREAAGLVERVEEKKLLLAALGSINLPDAAQQIAPFLEDTATREEASVAAVNVIEKFTGARNPVPLPASLRPVLEKIASTTANADLARRARTILEKNR